MSIPHNCNCKDKITYDQEQLQFIESIVHMAHVLGLYFVAEGVETKEQLELLSKCRCDSIQEYLFSKPVSENDAIHFLTRVI